ADVDTRSRTVVNVALKDVRSVGYKNNLERPNSDGTITPEMINTGIAALSELKAQAQALSPQPTEFCAVATAALRKAKNGNAVVKAIEQHVKIPVKIINQDEEATLGFRGAISSVGTYPERTLV